MDLSFEWTTYISNLTFYKEQEPEERRHLASVDDRLTLLGFESYLFAYVFYTKFLFFMFFFTFLSVTYSTLRLLKERLERLGKGKWVKIAQNMVHDVLVVNYPLRLI
jgi:hypothetical protein